MAFSIEHVRPPRPLQFSSSDPEWEMGQTSRHLNLCVYLRDMLLQIAAPSSTVGSDQFVYFDASDDRRKCAPDAFVKLGVAHGPVDSWKTWEKGTPELCVEIVSASDAEKLTQAEKLSRFHSMGVREVIFFDALAPSGQRIRAWDWLEGDLVERVVRGDRTPCITLCRWFHVGPIDDEPVALFLAGDEAGTDPALTYKQITRAAEVARAAAEAARVDAETEREAERARADRERAQRIEAESRIAELEATLRAKG
ncbi:hypothetical protein BH09MYX1_BH09MYX1_45360 [soil metagenome]